MKIFTKTAVAFLASLAGVGAHAQYDLKVNSISTMATSSNQIAPNVPISVVMEIENVGADIPDQTQFNVFAIVNGDTVGNLVWTFVNGNYPNGATGFVNTDNFVLPAAPPNVSICGAAVLIGLAETSYLNNVVCDNYTVSSSANPDFAAVGLNINAPNDLDSFDIFNELYAPSPITDVNATFVNTGNVTFPAGYSIAYIIEFEGATSPWSGTLQEALAPGDTTIRPSVDPSFTVPTAVGYYDVCAIVNVGFGDISNDTSCTGFTIIDTYIPPPIGVKDVETGDFSIRYAARYLMVDGVASPVQIAISDVQGRVVVQTSASETTSISLHELPAGVYTVQSTGSKMQYNRIRKIVVE